MHIHAAEHETAASAPAWTCIFMQQGMRPLHQHLHRQSDMHIHAAGHETISHASKDFSGLSTYGLMA